MICGLVVCVIYGLVVCVIYGLVVCVICGLVVCVICGIWRKGEWKFWNRERRGTGVLEGAMGGGREVCSLFRVERRRVWSG